MARKKTKKQDTENLAFCRYCNKMAEVEYYQKDHYKLCYRCMECGRVTERIN